MTCDVLQRISDTYYDLTDSEQRIAEYVSKNVVAVQELSISELADLVRVSEATVSRFCRRLGYKSYSSFKLNLALSNHQTAVMSERSDTIAGYLQESIDALNQTYNALEIEQIQMAARLLNQAQQIVCMGQGASMILAQECAHLFSLIKPNVRAVMDSHMQAIISAQLQSEDVVIYFSYSGSTRELMDNLRILRQSGVKVILITRFPKSPGANLSDVILRCMSYEGPLEGGSVSARIAQLFLLDILFHELEKIDDQSKQRRDRVGSVLADKHL